jgi:hypothetical protein
VTRKGKDRQLLVGYGGAFGASATEECAETANDVSGTSRPKRQTTTGIIRAGACQLAGAIGTRADITTIATANSELAQLLRLRAQCSLTKLVALTGTTDGASRPETDERIFDAHLIKPLPLDDLENVLRPS